MYTSKIQAFLKKYFKFLPDLPFHDSDRNDKLRADITKRLSSQFLTDDERAIYFGLPNGCRIREGAKIIAKANLKIGENC